MRFFFFIDDIISADEVLAAVQENKEEIEAEVSFFSSETSWKKIKCSARKLNVVFAVGKNLIQKLGL
jgi:hypothetical protein